MNLLPTQIQPGPSSQFVIQWNSGETFLLPYRQLRFLCPCANCVDEHTGQRTIELSAIPLDVKPTQVFLVGRYAVQLHWSDGHKTGMVHFDNLHAICLVNGQKINPTRADAAPETDKTPVPQ